MRKSKTPGKHESGGTAKKTAPKKQKVLEPPKKKEPKPKRQPFLKRLIFGEEKADTAAQVLQNWEVLKMSEKDGNKMVLSGVPRSLPSLIKAERVQEKAANVGFDWQQREDVWDKVREEFSEVEAELKQGQVEDREKEFGDLFFSLVNAARLYNVRPDNALERTNRKFLARFNYIEQKANEQGRHVNELTLAEMDELWNEAKAQKLGE